MHVRGTQRPRVLDITQPIEEWLTSLDADAVAADIAAGAESPTFELSVRGWVIGLSAWPVLPERRGEADRLIGAYFPFGGVRMLDDIVRIRTILRKKGSQYGPLDAPLVVALLSWSTVAGKRDMTNAALGSIGVSYVPGDVRSAQPVRRRNGYWRPPPELRGTRISGVLFGEHHLGLWSPASVLPGLWVNPWAETRLEVSLPFATVTADDSGEILSEDASVTPRDVFGLSRTGPMIPSDLQLALLVLISLSALLGPAGGLQSDEQSRAARPRKSSGRRRDTAWLCSRPGTSQRDGRCCHRPSSRAWRCGSRRSPFWVHPSSSSPDSVASIKLRRPRPGSGTGWSGLCRASRRWSRRSPRWPSSVGRARPGPR